jgi:hypothetical protein
MRSVVTPLVISKDVGNCKIWQESRGLVTFMTDGTGK